MHQLEFAFPNMYNLHALIIKKYGKIYSAVLSTYQLTFSSWWYSSRWYFCSSSLIWSYYSLVSFHVLSSFPCSSSCSFLCSSSLCPCSSFLSACSSLLSPVPLSWCSVLSSEQSRSRPPDNHISTETQWLMEDWTLGHQWPWDPRLGPAAGHCRPLPRVPGLLHHSPRPPDISTAPTDLHSRTGFWQDCSLQGRQGTNLHRYGVIR